MSDIERQRAEAAAEILLRARREKPIADLPEDLRPRSEAEAYAVQDAVARALGPVIGWKVGASAPDAEPACAPLLAGTIHESPARLDAQAFALRGIEAEIAFRFGAAPERSETGFDRDSVLGAIATAHPAIEVCESRFHDHSAIDPLTKLADNNLNGALVLGPAWADWRRLEAAAQPVAVTIDEREIAARRGGNAAGDLFRLLVWLAEHLARRGRPLRAGDIVTTGSWTGMHVAGTAKRVGVSFPGVGDAEVVFADGAA